MKSSFGQYRMMKKNTNSDADKHNPAAMTPTDSPHSRLKIKPVGLSVYLEKKRMSRQEYINEK